jgi:hypothetical protein
LGAGVLDEALERVVSGLLDDVGVLLNLAGFEREDRAREALREADAADGQSPTQPNVTLDGAAGNLEAGGTGMSSDWSSSPATDVGSLVATLRMSPVGAYAVVMLPST